MNSTTLRDMAEIDRQRLHRHQARDSSAPTPIRRRACRLLDDDQAGLLLEVMKDLLYQAYVRKGRLQQAMVVRRFFSDQAERPPAAAEHGSRSPERSTDPG